LGDNCLGINSNNLFISVILDYLNSWVNSYNLLICVMLDYLNSWVNYCNLLLNLDMWFALISIRKIACADKLANLGHLLHELIMCWDAITFFILDDFFLSHVAWWLEIPPIRWISGMIGVRISTSCINLDPCHKFDYETFSLCKSMGVIESYY
jgi:hypothetical protein